MDIKNELLIGIIQEYIKNKEPIGSEFLKSQKKLEVSSATIRNYFKILEKEGALFQPHISSGRIPTHLSLHSYWKNALRSLTKNTVAMDINRMSNLSSMYQLYCIAIPKEDNILEDIINFKNEYLILQFSRNETIIKFSEALSRFLESLKNMNIQDIIKVANEVGAGELKRKLLAVEQVDFEETSYRYGGQFLKDIIYTNTEIFMDLFYAKALLKYQNGIYFDNFLPSGYMAIIHDIHYWDNHRQTTCQARMMCVGSLVADYQSFYKELGVSSFV